MVYGASLGVAIGYRLFLDSDFTVLHAWFDGVALSELNRVCKDGGMLIIPTYMNKDDKGKTNGFSDAAQKAGADFKREFTMESYRQFFLDAGYPDAKISLAEGRIPCAVAVMRKRQDESI